MIWLLAVSFTYHPGFTEYYRTLDDCNRAARWYVSISDAVTSCQVASRVEVDALRQLRPEDGRPRIVP